MIGIGTFVNWFFVGPIASWFTNLFTQWIGVPSNFLEKLAIMAVGVVILSFSCALYQTADVGISTLGCYRRGLTRCSSLKAREYAAAGLPFLYAYDDDSLTGKEPFALRVPNDDTPVDMEQLIAFVERCRRQADCSRQERTFAEEQYDWKAMMQRILAFLGA